MPDEHKNGIMHARLTFGENMLMFSDGMPGTAISHGNGINLSVSMDSKAQALSVFDKLAEGGIVIMPMEKQFWGALFGMAKDRFGITWMINCDI